jgi:hypothetical protein
MTPVSSANNIHFDAEFILRGTTDTLELILGELHVSLCPSHRKNVGLH